MEKMRIFLSAAAILSGEEPGKRQPERKLFPQPDHRISTAAGSNDRNKFSFSHLKRQIRQSVGFAADTVIGIGKMIHL